jgi:hypothetical protein
MTVDVERVRHYPGGSWLDVDKRSVELAVPVDALVAPLLALDVSPAAQRAIAASVPVVAFTAKGRATVEAIVGATGALRVARVVPAR